MKRILLRTACVGLIFITGVVQGQERAASSPEKSQASNGPAYRKTLEFLIAERLVKRNKKTDAPGTVTGDIRYGFERIDSGWLIYLYSPERSERTVNAEINLDIRKVHLVVAIRNLLNNEPFQGYSFKIPVAPGQYRVLKVWTESFEPDYSDYFN